MFFLILILPLLSSLVISSVGFRIGRHGSAALSTFLLFLTWVLALFLLFEAAWYQII